MDNPEKLATRHRTKTKKHNTENQKVEQYGSNRKPGRTQAPTEGKQFLPLITRTLSFGYTSGNTNL